MECTLQGNWLKCKQEAVNSTAYHREFDLSHCRIEPSSTKSCVFTIYPDDDVTNPTLKRPTTFMAATKSDRKVLIEAWEDSQIKAGHVDTAFFEALEVVGKGHFGSVRLIRHKSSQMLFAMKTIRLSDHASRHGTTTPQAVEERAILQAVIDQPFALQLHWAFSRSCCLYFVTEFCSGGDLYSLMRKQQLPTGTATTALLPSRRFSLAHARFYAAEIAMAVKHLHSLNIVHRDLKPENILIAQDGHIRIADFGLAKQLKSASDRCYSFCGTDSYLAPEMIQGSWGHGFAVDYWQLGCITFEMITGSVPFVGKRQEVYETIQEKAAVWPVPLDDLQNHNELLTQLFPSDSQSSSSCSVSLQTQLNAAKDFVESLLKKRFWERLGSGEHGTCDVEEHAFFDSLVWEKIEKKSTTPPSIPLFNYDTASTPSELDSVILPLSSTVESIVGFHFCNFTPRAPRLSSYHTKGKCMPLVQTVATPSPPVLVPVPVQGSM